jgi:large subunit ribosomal protein L15
LTQRPHHDNYQADELQKHISSQPNMSAATLSTPALAGAALRASTTTTTATFTVGSQIPRCIRTYASSSQSSEQTPRWLATPASMAMPVRTRSSPRPRQCAPYVANKDAQILDKVYNTLLGSDGDTVLPEEIKWLAVTHKSFDHARRGFNDKLAFLGKRLCDMQCSLALLDAPASSPLQQQQQQQQGGTEKQHLHPAMRGVGNVTAYAKSKTLDKVRVAGLARQYGIDGVVRWKPKNVSFVFFFSFFFFSFLFFSFFLLFFCLSFFLHKRETSC